MRLGYSAGIILAVLALVFAGAAAATTSDPRLDEVSSRLAGHPTSVQCYARGETGDPFVDYGAWGYVYMADHLAVNLAAEVCEGAIAIANHDATVPMWKQGLGALVLAHESFHQRLNTNRSSESATECRAVRHLTVTIRLLGGSAELAVALRPFAWAMHYRLLWLFPQYGLKSCKAPWWWH
jgi:hypothetical protein